MSAILAVRNTFIQLVAVDSESSPTVQRAYTHNHVEKVEQSTCSGNSTDDDLGYQPCLSRESTFDEFDVPCMIGRGPRSPLNTFLTVSALSAQEQTQQQPKIDRCTTYDEFEQPCALPQIGQYGTCPAHSFSSRLPPSGDSTFERHELDRRAVDAENVTPHDFILDLVGKVSEAAESEPAVLHEHAAPNWNPYLTADHAVNGESRPMTYWTTAADAGSVPYILAPAEPTRANAVDPSFSARSETHQQVTKVPIGDIGPKIAGHRRNITQMSEMATDILPNGAVRITWCADSRRFVGRGGAAVSPAVQVDLPRLGLATFKIIVRAESGRGAGNRGNFRDSSGHGIVELKCEALPPDNTYKVTLDRQSGATLGVDLESGRTRHWRIKRVNPGLVEKWNDTRSENSQISVGDSIISVNGISGNLASVKNACMKNDVLDIVLKRGNHTAPLVVVSCAVGEVISEVGIRSRRPVWHNFAERTCCRTDAGRPDATWDLIGLSDKRTKKVRIACDIMTVM